ncbi:polysaccharide biosynthesis tyrosine autokinase [Gillisia sp. M10.2A]|uniref:non-specific protein-tyrosine kinase n=1 Tax=Gillisia lutea TaxID=2909668 RepID=A0ABS9EH26_9FLAO|nr:tyrosine-protein kinase family protein [Gillisia lutea]MCF4102192.1 polysaccharide biosynthesis tyrosine autokinase [Gillisia lutea]
MAISKKRKNNITHNFSVREELAKYLKHWPWFLLSIVLSLVLGYFYLRYTTPIYSATASIIVKDAGDGGGGDAASYADLGVFSGIATHSIENEIAILRSRRLMEQVVKALNVNIQYFQEGSVRTAEIYKDLPFSLKVLKLNESRLKELGGAQFKLEYAEGKFRLTNLQTLSYYTVEGGAPFNIGFADIVIVPNFSNDTHQFVPIIVNFSQVESVASHYRNTVVVGLSSNKSSVIELLLKDPVQDKARDILDQLIFEYNRDAIDDRNLIAENTANFINDRLALINGELDSVESGKEKFKEYNRLTNIDAESQLFIQNASDYNKSRHEVGMQLELANAMLDYITSNTQSDLLPSNLGIDENGINQLIGDYNNLVIQRSKILNSSTDKNPVKLRLDTQIDQLKGNILQSLRTMRSNLIITQSSLDRQSSNIGSKILAVPSKEREYRGIERQQSIKEALYLFLLQKREENSLSMAVTAPKAKIVDRAYSAGNIVSPNRRSILLGTMVLGFMLPFTVIYMSNILDNKVRNKADVENIDHEIPFLGELPKVQHKKDLFISENDRSILAESFRILMANLQCLLSNFGDKKKATTIFVTSTVKGEGKTFTSLNLAITLANTGHKVLIIGADLRNPKLQNFKVENSQNLGVSDFLMTGGMDIKNLIDKSRLNENLSILSSGSIPTNPTFLLNQKKVGDMFQELEGTYDYLIVDTAPSMVVADTFFISKFAHLIVYVIKAGFTEKKLLDFVKGAKNEGMLKKVGFVLNNVTFTHFGYGRKYPYGYGQEKKTLWTRIKRKRTLQNDKIN